MGLVAQCACRRDRSDGKLKVLLESGELILCGEMCRSIPLADMKETHVKGEELRFTVGDESFSLSLGRAEAVKWAETIAGSRPSPTKQPDVTLQTSTQLLGAGHEDTIQAVLEEAAQNAGQPKDLIVALINTPDALVAALEHAVKRLARGIPIWIIYPESSGHAPKESHSLVSPFKMNGSNVTVISPRPPTLRFQ